MNRAALFANPARSDRTSRGRPSAPAAFPVRPWLDAMQLLAQFLFVTPAAARQQAAQPYPWLPDRIRSRMGARARRLMRADG